MKKSNKKTSDNYQRHLNHLRGFSDGAGSRPMNPECSNDQDYSSGYVAGQVSKRMFAEASAKALGVKLSTITTA